MPAINELRTRGLPAKLRALGLGLVPAALAAFVSGNVPVSTAQAQAAAPATAANSTTLFTPAFRDVELAQVAEAVSLTTGKTFIVDPRVRAQVNLISSTPMTPAELYQAFLSVLQVHGFAAVPSGNLVKIIPSADARTLPGNDLPTRASGGPDEMVTQVISVRNTGAAQLVQVLRPLVATTAGLLQSVPGSNTLIISDRASNVERIIRIVRRIDQAGDANIEVVPLQNSTAADVVRTLAALNAGQPAGDASGLGKVVADDRSNSVLISGEASQRLRIAALIAHLDTPVENGGETQVRYLRFADAEKIAPKLKEQITGVAQAAAAPGGGGAAAAAADKSTTIWADSETNALVITAPPKTMRSLMTVVDKLDIRRPQVLVEAIIVDVSTNKSADLGVNWALLSRDGSNVPVGGFVAPIGTAGGSPASIVDLAKIAADPIANVGSIPNGTTLAVGRIASTGINFAAVLRALRSDSNTNVIATPTGTTMDNQEMELKVAQEVPFITGQYSTSTGGAGAGGQGPNPFTTIQREEVGTILKITPQISSMENNLVMLKIELESSELSGTVGDAGSRITNKRSINTSVLIEDQGVIVLGGLIRDSSQRGEDRVPFLGRIPLIGEAFRVRNSARVKQNLMVFIRPKILRDGMQTSFETNSKYNAIRDEQKSQGPRGELLPLLPGDKPPLLPTPPPPPPPEVVQPTDPRQNSTEKQP